jgi:Uma2 family endonuclease
VLVVKGVPKRRRRNYLIWAEGKTLDLVIELTSASTRNEDLGQKFELYQNTLRVKEYFLFDPLSEYLDPPLRGYRLRKGLYVPIRAVHGRLPSQVLGLHLERNGEDLRSYDAATGCLLATPEEAAEQAKAAQRQAAAEVERLKRELRKLRRRLNEGQ